MTELEHRRFGGLSFVNLDPVFVLVFEEGWRVDDYVRMSEALVALLPERMAFLSVVRRVRPAGTLERQAIAETMERFRDELEHRIAVSAVVTHSSIMRSVIRAVAWISPISYPVPTFERVGDAVLAVEEALALEGILLSSATREALLRLDPDELLGEEAAG